MAETFEQIEPKLARFVEKQHMFFVATAPADLDGRINLSPKGLDTFRILDSHTVAYLDLTGSGIETISHLRDNGRIVIMFCAFEGAAQILRLYGRGEVIEPGHPEWEELRGGFPPANSDRSIIRVALERISTSCGYGVPLMDFVKVRPTLAKYWDSFDPGEYRDEHNRCSIDGLPGLPSLTPTGV